MIKCIKCGKEHEDGMEFCNECGTKLVVEEEVDIKNGPTNKTVTEDSKSYLDVMAIISGALGVIFWGIGFYKYLSYDSGEYSDSINAYVGGDAYNYIINGTYFTAFSVIGGVFILGAFIMFSASYLKK